MATTRIDAPRLPARPLTREHLPAVAMLIGLVLISQAAGFLGALVGGQSETYRELALPSWAPPGGVFAPVWIILYTLMGIAAWLVWRTWAGAPRRAALAWFGAQLVVNAAWTPVFFGLGSPVGGLVVLVALLPLVAGTLIAFGKRSSLAAALLVPYLLWATYALALNAAIVWLNR
jgi:translocator protein